MSKDICKIFGKKLADLRKEKGWTQEELGFEVNMSNSVIGKYENGTRCPNLRIAKKIAHALGVKLSQMLD